MFDITASIVLFHNDRAELEATVKSFLNTEMNVRLLLIDNSPTDDLRNFGELDRCDYVFNNANLGFGKAHNIAILSILNQTRYHLILNPDVTFDSGILKTIFDYMQSNPDVGLLLPKVLDFSGQLQYVARRLPTPFDLVVRRLGFPALTRLFDRQLQHHEMRDKDHDHIFDAPSLSGCFMFASVPALNRAGLFDERFFMYLEDIDLTRRIHRHFRTIYYPAVSIQHGHARESYRLNRLLLIHMASAAKYFTKWGWFFDRERKLFNNE